MSVMVQSSWRPWQLVGMNRKLGSRSQEEVTSLGRHGTRCPLQLPQAQSDGPQGGKQEARLEGL